MKKTLSLICLGLSSMLVIAGCKKNETLEVEPVEQVEVVETEEETEVEPVEEEIVEPEEEKVLPWAEENDISFSTEKEFSGPVYALATSDEEGKKVMEELSFSEVNSKSVLKDITISDADEEGYVVYTITYDGETSFSMEFNQDFNLGTFNYWWGDILFFPMDYYTGTVFPHEDVYTHFDLGENTYEKDNVITTDVSYEGINYSVSVAQNINSNIVESGWKDTGDGNRKETVKVSTTYTYTIKLPREYDGLVLAVVNEDNFVPSGDRPDYYDAYILGSEDDVYGKDVSEYNYLKVSDIVKDFENNDAEDTDE